MANFRWLQKKAKDNPALLWNFIGYGVTAISGPLAAILISTQFSPDQQGYYYTFGSLLGLQIFLELGFGVCLVHVVSHEYAHLKLSDDGILSGPEYSLKRIASLYQLAHRWFFVAAVVFVIGVGFAGELFFRNFSYGVVSWRLPWWFLCIGSAAILYQLAPMSILQGCNLIEWTARARAIQNLVKSVLLIGLIAGGAGLFSASVATCVSAGALWMLLNRKWLAYFKQLKGMICGSELSWHREIWPFQSRIALSWASGFFIFSSFNPIIFAKIGAVSAGQFGMTWAILGAISNMSQIFITTQQAQFGIKIVRGEWKSLKILWGNLVRLSLIFCAGLAVTFLICVEVIGMTTNYGARFLKIYESVPLVLAIIANQYIFGVATLARSEKKEPFLWPSILSAILVVGGNFAFIGYYGLQGIAWNYCVVALMSLVVARMIFKGSLMTKNVSEVAA